MRRILLLITDLEIGGTPTVVRELAVRLRRPGLVHVEVASLAPRGPVAQQLDDAAVATVALGARGVMEFPRVVRDVRRLVCDGQVDTVISFLVHANAVAAVAIRSCPPGVRFIQSIQTTQPTPRWHWWVQRFAQESAGRILVPSSAVAQVAIDRCGVEPAKIAIIPNAIDPSEFAPAQIFRGPVVRVGFLGRLDPVKNISAMLGAMRLLSDSHVECHIFGEGPERSRIERTARAADLRARVFLHGAVARAQEALARMDLLVLPSHHEGFGLVLIEAMAAGVPVIAAASGGALDIVKNEVNGLLFSPSDDDTVAIATCIRRLIGDPSLRDRLIQGGGRTVREKFAWNVVLPRYWQLLELDEETP